ncbi:MAG: hypothetical protein ACPHP8_08695 [Luminiphilus sp.]
MTQYTLRATIAAPITMLAECNALAVCLGESAGDINTFTSATHADAEGNEYAVASTVAKPVFTEMAASELVAPEYSPDVDLEAAARAQATLVIGDKAAPERMTAIVGDRTESAQDHLAALGLSLIPVEDDLP